MPDQPINAILTRKLPKIELHAHLTGSVSRECLREIWLQRKVREPGFDLKDPLLAFAEIEEGGWDVGTFFPLFSNYIYRLCDDLSTLHRTTTSVLQAFHSDGVVYLELRTTPRNLGSSDGTVISKETYVSTILSCIEEFNERVDGSMRTYLILSVDRRNSAPEALEVVDLAVRFQNRGVVGVDLCGDPSKHCDVSRFRDAFAKAKHHGLGLTLHFAEVPASARKEELNTLLSFHPDRLGHVICIPEDVREEIVLRRLALELCLSCNVHAGLTEGGFAGHHFGEWKGKGCPIILCTDDVGIFGSPLSNEYLIAAQHFQLNHDELLDLYRNAIDTIFGGEQEKTRLKWLLDSYRASFSGGLSI